MSTNAAVQGVLNFKIIFFLADLILRNQIFYLTIFFSLSLSPKQQQHSGGKGKNSGHSSAHQSKGAAQQTMDDDGVPYQYTMYDDVANNPTVVQMLVSTRQAIHLTHQKCKKYLESWKKYDRQFGLWDTSKMKTVQKSDHTAHTTVFFDGRLSGYDSLGSQVKLRSTKLEIDFVHLDCFPCSVTVRMQAQKWKYMYGSICHNQIRKRLNILTEKFKGLTIDLQVEPSDLSQFKFLLGKIREVDEMGMVTELEMNHIIETFGMLRKYGIIKLTDETGVAISVGDGAAKKKKKKKKKKTHGEEEEEDESDESDESEEDENSSKTVESDDLVLGGELEKTLDELGADNREWIVVDNLRSVFKNLYHSAKTLEMRQSKLKDDFCETTKTDVIAYAELVEIEWRKMKETGAGSSSAADNLDRGLELLEDAQLIVGKMEKRRMELVSAERLFDLANTEYPGMNQMKEELLTLEIIYSLYSEMQEFAHSQSGTLWSQLNIKMLLEGATILDKKAQKLKKKIQPTRSILEAVVNHVVAFRESLPLIEQLKSPAMKARHWKELMVLTGVTFDMDPKTFKLRNIFAMNLARFGDEVNKISYKANQELKIETQLSILRAYWKKAEFTVRDYRKDGQLRGFILGSTEEIKLDLDDELLNLTSIGGAW